MNVSRRKLLGTSVGVALAGFFGARLPQAFAAAEDVGKLISDFTGGSAPVDGPITLTTPEIAENGNSVPVTVSVDSPMTEESYVESIMLVAEGNPSPAVATIHLTPASGVAQASTRMRLAKTQNVTALAKMSDGTIYTASNNVKVTIGGCGG